MKKIFIIIISIIICMGCAEEPAQKTDLYVFIDFTEGQHYELENEVGKYLSLMNITADNNRNYGEVRIFPIYDMASSVSSTVKLKEGKSKLEGNKYVRQKELDAFKKKVAQKLASINSTHTGKALKSSHIFQPICKGVVKLEKSNANRKVILIYSDMLENSPLANFHSTKVSFEKLKSSFDQHWNVEDMSDLEFYIVYPLDKNNDRKIRNASLLWRKYFEEKGLPDEQFHFDTSIDI